MATPDIHKQLTAVLKKLDRPAFILFGYQDETGNMRTSYSLHKARLKPMLLAMFTALADIIKRAMK